MTDHLLALMRAMLDDPDDGGRDLTEQGRERLRAANEAALVSLRVAATCAKTGPRGPLVIFGDSRVSPSPYLPMGEWNPR